jgi:uncharacterized protein YbjT (DUF2867 family)
MDSDLIVLAGATGDLGQRIARKLIERGGRVRALVRADSDPAAITNLRGAGADIAVVDFSDPADLARACAGASCVVSALSGLQDVILVGQSALLDAAVAAGVPRFIPSDYAIDYTRLAPGTNRNLDLRRAFQARLDGAPIAATSILCGMFMDLLVGQAPIILFKFKRVAYWENAEQTLDFTTKDNAAAFTAAAALDPASPRFLRIAGDRQSAEGLRAAASAVGGAEFRLLRAGGLDRLTTLIKLMRAIMPQRKAVYPPWQGMQYLHNMFGGRAALKPLDNHRYPGIQWTSVRELLAGRSVAQPVAAAAEG